MQNVSFITLAEYGIKYYHTHTDDSGTTVRVRIYQHGFTGAAQEFGGLRALRLDIQGGTDDITAPIVKTSLVMTLADTPEYSTAGLRMGGWSEFYTPDATKYYITVERSVTGGYALLWAGYITPDSWSESLGVDGDVTVTVRDNIGHLSDFPFDATPDNNGLISIEGLILAALTKIKFPMALHYYKAAEAQVSMLTSGGTTLWDAKVNTSHFKDMDWGEVLEEVLGDLGMVLRFVGGGAYWCGPLRDMPKLGGNTIRSSANDLALTFIGSNNLRQIEPAYKQIIETAAYETNSEADCDIALGRTGYSDSTSAAYKLGLTSGTMTVWQVEGASPGWDALQKNHLNTSGLSVGASAQSIYGNHYADGCFIGANRTQPTPVKFKAYAHTAGVTLRFTIDARPAGIYNSTALDCYPFCQVQSVKYRIYYGPYSLWDGGWEQQGGNPSSRYIREATFGGQTGEDLTVEVALPPCTEATANTDQLLAIQIEDVQFTDTMVATSFYLTGCYARIVEIAFAQGNAEAIVAGNVVTTVNDEKMNVTLNRKVSLAALSYDSGRINEQTYENILYRLANNIPTPWGYTCQWGDQSTALPFPVQNHLAILCYHYTGMEVLEGDCIQTGGTSWRVDAIHSYKGARFILLGGTLDLVTGRMTGATFHTFVEFIDTWGTSPSVDYTVNEGAAGNTSGTGSGYSGGGASGGGGGGGVTPTPSSLDEYFASLQSQIDAVSARNSFDDLLATVLNTDILTAQSIYGETLEVTGGAAIGGAASVGGLLTVGSIKLAAGTPTLTWDSTNSAWHLTGNFYADGWIAAGGVGSGGGGGGGGTTVSWGTATSNYTPLTVGSDTRNLSVYGHKHNTSDIYDFSAAVAALIAGSDLATTVAGHTTAINTLNGYFENSKLKFSALPTLYWADVAVSSTSQQGTEPTFMAAYATNFVAPNFMVKAGNDIRSVIKGHYDFQNAVFELVDFDDDTSILAFGDGVGGTNGDYGVFVNDIYNKGVLIHSPLLHLSTQLTFTAEQSDSGNTFDKGLEYSTTNHAWHLKGNLYVDGFISAGGLSSGGGGGGSVVSWTSTIETDTANVIGLQVGSESHFFYTKPWGDALDLRVQALEAGSALTITTTGSGNAVTDVSKSGTVITVTKGETFLTAASLDGAEAALASLQSQVDSVSARNSYDELSATVFNADIVTATTAYIESIVGSLTGNAATATKLAATKTINGAAFDGSANIVTLYWGAERTITIKDNDGTNYRQNPNIDGSANFDLILPSTIKATLTGNATTATTLQTARSINGTSFNGSEDIITAKWGTARTITVKDYTSTNSKANSSIDGSADFNLILPESLKVKNLAATGALSVAGVATMSSTLDVTGAVSLSSSLTVAGNSTLQGNLTVNGNTTLGNNAQSDTLNVNSITTIAGTVTTRSTLDVNLAANQTVPSSAAAKKLRVWGPSYFQGAITLSNGNKSVVLSISQDGYLEVDGDMYATGFISAGGVS